MRVMDIMTRRRHVSRRVGDDAIESDESRIIMVDGFFVRSIAVSAVAGCVGFLVHPLTRGGVSSRLLVFDEVWGLEDALGGRLRGSR